MELIAKSSGNNLPQLCKGNHLQGLRGSGDWLRWSTLFLWMITCHLIINNSNDGYLKLTS